jgi:hypothetical protein
VINATVSRLDFNINSCNCNHWIVGFKVGSIVDGANVGSCDGFDVRGCRRLKVGSSLGEYDG